MKKLALIIACLTCWCCAFVYAQNPVNVYLTNESEGQLQPHPIAVKLNIDGAAQLDYLHVSDPSKFIAVKLGYDADAVFKQSLDLTAGDYNYMEVVLKDLGGTTDWMKVKFNLNESYPNNSVKIGDYLNVAEDLGDGWFRVKIPVDHFSPEGMLSHITFPNTFNTDIGIKEILFTGSEESFEWLGEGKYDNAVKENQPGQAEFIFSSEGIIPHSAKLYSPSQDLNITDTSMPFVFSVNTIPGENIFFAELTDDQGNVYLSDTLKISVSSGITFRVTDVSCYGASDGSIDINISGGTEPYAYEWSNGATTEDINGLSAGVYAVTVTDAEGSSTTSSIVLKEPGPIHAGLSGYGCSEDSVVLDISGGYGPYEYSLNGGAFQSISNEKKVLWDIEVEPDPLRGWDEGEIKGLGDDLKGNVYLSGNYTTKVHVGDITLGADDEKGSYLLKLDDKGEKVWGIHKAGLWFHDSKTDTQGNTVVFSGAFADVEWMGFTIARGSYLLYFDTDGQLIRTKSIQYGQQMEMDAFGNVYILTTDYFEPNSKLIKYSPVGDVLWTKHITARLMQVEDVEVASDGTVYMIGHFEGQLQVDYMKLQSKYERDGFIAKLSPLGEVQWLKQGSNSDNDVWGRAVAADGKDLFMIMEFYKPNGQYDGQVFDDGESVLMKLDVNTGSLIWHRKLSTSDFLYTMNYADMKARKGTLYMNLEIPHLILRPDEDFRTDVNMLVEMDYEGHIKDTQILGSWLFEYGLIIKMHIKADGQVIYESYRDGFGKTQYAIRTRGYGSSQKLKLNNHDETIVVRDANGCSFELDSLVIDDNIPDTPVICGIDVLANGNSIKFADDQLSVLTYNIYKETDATDNFELIGQTSNYKFFDSEANAQVRSYKYVVTAVNECENESDYSVAHRTMHLTVNEGNLGQINLIWDGYEGFEYDSYDIYRGSSAGDMEMIASVPSYLYTYTDLDPSFYTQYYQIVVGSDHGCEVDSSGKSSNGRTTEGNAQRTASSNIATKFGEAGNLTMYPVPAKDRVSIKFSPDGNEYVLKVIDNRGRTVQTQKGIHNEAVINRGNLPAGLYTISLSSGSGEPLHGRIVFE